MTQLNIIYLIFVPLVHLPTMLQNSSAVQSELETQA